MTTGTSITKHGDPLTLKGDEISVGDTAPDFTALDVNFKEVKLSDFKGEVVIISAVPSLDTSVCELQTEKFNEEAAKLKAKVITVSMDLPFAQKRFCSSHTINSSITLSDFKEREFANKYGLYINELGLIARAVLIINAEGKVVYKEIVSDISEHPNYDAVLNAVKEYEA